jgi:hypothetical protein
MNPSVDPLLAHWSDALLRQPPLQSLRPHSRSAAGVNPGGHWHGGWLLWLQMPKAPQSAYTSHCTVGAAQKNCQLWL